MNHTLRLDKTPLTSEARKLLKYGAYDDRYVHFVVIKDGQVVSSCEVSTWASHALVFSVRTLPEYQRQGYASQLMRMVRDWAIKTPKMEDLALLRSDHPGALPLYKGVGFVTVDGHPDYPRMMVLDVAALRQPCTLDKVPVS